MYSIRNWFSLILCLVGIYMFVCFDDFALDKEYVNDAIGTKSRAIRSLLYTITQNKFGYWIVRFIPLLVGLGFGKSFVDEIRNEKK
ncbi:hypothetical protein ABW636_06275 [Aquimarina sp. 2201CG1-2-11]|uniref:hypothetical protein n=1 Tax=Aquimarina discodermiae TaxID=3231043 RepID=UPI003461BB40